MDRTTFLEHLRESRLLDDEQLSRVVGRFGEDAAAQTIASVLTEEGMLTRFQARQVWEGKARGLVLGQYRILEELGEGGFGRVYKAVHTLMDRQVALKVIAPELVENSGARSWFRREVLAYTELSHPNIVMAYDANEVDGILFLVMEYVDGPNLDALVKSQGPLPAELGCELLRQAGLALQHAHEKGMVHRDIKPANLLLPRGPGGSGDGVLVKVVDFGLARLQTPKAGTVMLQNESSFLGTPDYVSPEQARSVHNVDIRSDLYSLGCTFYFALTGRKPFVGKSLMEVLIQHLEADPEPLEATRPDVPEGVRRAVRRLMAKNPADRFATPAEMVAELAPYCKGEVPRVSVPAVVERPAPAAPSAAPGTNGATALVPQLAFWEGPQMSRTRVVTAEPPPAEPPPPEPPPAEVAATRCVALAAARVPQPAIAPEEAPTPAAEPPPQTVRADAELRKCWQDWLTVVDAFAHGGGIRVNEAAYRSLHSRLLARCRAGGDARPAVLKRVEAVIEPWLTPHTLAATDKATLMSLLRHCAALDREMYGRVRGSAWPWLGLLLVLAPATLLGWYLSRCHGWPAPVAPAVDWLQDLVTARPLLVLGVTVPAVVLAVIAGLTRLLRA